MSDTRSPSALRLPVRLAGALVLAALTAFALASTASAATLFAPTAQPLDPGVRNDGRPIEVGMRLRSDQAGYITALRFFKGTGNTGTHIGHLWSANGQQLAEARYTGETTSGWQQVSLSSPVPVTANAVYTVSYHSAGGGYSFDPDYFSSQLDNPPLHALADSNGGNGVYGYGFIAFPFQAFRQANYWVDAVFSTTTRPSASTRR
jgi:hypothetical protein